MKEFKAKVSYGLLIPVLALLAGFVAMPIINGDELNVIILISAIMLLTIAFLLHIFLGTTYRINDRNQLMVKSGFIFNASIEIANIRSIRKTRNLISSPAPSFDRIEIKYGEWDMIIISPKDKHEFARALLKINPDIDSQLN